MSTILGLTLGLALGLHAGAGPAKKTRAVVVFDNSRSMMNNDPQRLAQAAAMLFLDLARPGDEAGLDIFDEGSRSVVPIGPVQARRPAFSRALKRTRLDGHSTNLGQALSHALHTLNSAPKDPGTQEIVVLLTDGKLDLGAARRAEEPAERRRILRQIAPALRRRGARVYPIAFTDQADQQLLSEVAGGTQGAFSTIRSAPELHKAFTEIFVLSSGTDTLPIEDNRFVVDPSVKQTALVLSKTGANNQVVAPDEAVVDGAHPHPDVKWDSSKGYDLVELKNPQAGAWEVKGTEQAVAIVSDSSVRFEVDSAPSEPTMDVPVRITAQLLENDAPLSSFSKLKGMSVTARVKEPNGKDHTVVLKSVSVGRYEGDIQNPEPGQYGVVVTARSRTLTRQHKISYAVAPPCFEHSLMEPEQPGDPTRLVVEKTPTCPDYKKIKVLYARKLTGLKARYRPMQEVEPGRFLSEVALLEPSEEGEALVQIHLKTREGARFTVNLSPLNLPRAPPVSMVAQVLKILAVINIPLLIVAGIVFFVIRKRAK